MSVLTEAEEGDVGVMEEIGNANSRRIAAIVRRLEARVAELEQAIRVALDRGVDYVEGTLTCLNWNDTQALRAALQSTGEGPQTPEKLALRELPKRRPYVSPSLIAVACDDDGAAPTEAPRKYQVNCRERHCDFGPVTLTKMPDVTERNCPRCGEPLDIMSAALTGKEGER